MQKGIASFLVMGCCLCLVPSVVAADVQQPAIVVETPLYPLNQSDAGLLNVLCPAGERASVRVVQHSEERDALTLYEMERCPSADTMYWFALEPGDYSVEIAMPSVRDGFAMQTAQIPVRIGNPDFSETCRSAQYEVTLARDTDDSTVWSYRATAPQQQTADGIETTTQGLTFFFYEGRLGDVDGDGTVSAADATAVLQYYVQGLTGQPDASWAARQLALADIDANTKCDGKDATMILQYYTATLTGQRMDWLDFRSDTSDISA